MSTTVVSANLSGQMSSVTTRSHWTRRWRGLKARCGGLIISPNVRPAPASTGQEIIVTPKAEEAAPGSASAQKNHCAGGADRDPGGVDANLAKFRAGNRLVPIRVQADLGVRRDLAAILGAADPWRHRHQRAVIGGGRRCAGARPLSIERYDRVRRVVLGADLTGGIALGDALSRVFALPGATDVSTGIAVKRSGDAEIMAEVFSGFALAMGVGLVLVFALLVLLLRGVFQPLTILLSLPLSLGGVILALAELPPANQPAGRHRHPDADGHRH